MIPPTIQAHIDGLLKEADEYQRLADRCRDAASLLRDNFGGSPATSTADRQPPTSEAPIVIRQSLGNGSKLETRADWAEAVLRAAGHRMKIPDMMKVMLANGHGSHLKRATFFNSTFTAMGRRPDLFVKHEDGVWGLKEWEDAQAS